VDGLDVLKVSEIKISARGPQIGPNVHHTDEKLKDLKETNRNVHKNERIKESQ
jgi:hypothetical protein